jgi:small subunit ribosomal protein S13
MARIAGVDLPNNKKIEYALSGVYGLGLTSAREILDKLDIDHDKRVYSVTENELSSMQREISSHYTVEGDLRKEIRLNIKRLQEIGSYRGTRHKRSLPARGQRTKTNARGRKGPRRSASGASSKK